MTGRITKLIRSRACGFIRASNGQEVFFHASDVHGVKYDDLSDAASVRFTLIDDQVSGPRAARVRVERRMMSNGSGWRRTGADSSNPTDDQP